MAVARDLVETLIKQFTQPGLASLMTSSMVLIMSVMVVGFLSERLVAFLQVCLFRGARARLV